MFLKPISTALVHLSPLHPAPFLHFFEFSPCTPPEPSLSPPISKLDTGKNSARVFCLHISFIGKLPVYMAVDCVSVTSLPSRRHLRSAESGCLVLIGARIMLGKLPAKYWQHRKLSVIKVTRDSHQLLIAFTR